MYKKGEVKITTSPSAEVERCAFLPHSCDEWVIGGPNEVKQLIADLQYILKFWEDYNGKY